MQIIINNHNFKYEMENITRMFFHDRKLTIEYNKKPSNEDYVLTEICDGKIFVEVSALNKKQNKISPILDEDETKLEWQMAGLLYDCLEIVTKREQKWGLLTGVRPTRLVHRMLDENRSVEEIRNKFINEYRVSEEKFRLVYRTAKAERPIINDNKPNDFSLYISIPFCPSRCNYCSFVSSSVEKMGNIIPEYVKALGREIEDAAEIAKEAGLRLRSVYFGGGTPTTLSANELEFLMGKVRDNFDLKDITEYTVEAGRPDTITYDKLSAIYNMGADRISINPQTFNDEVLKAIGRKHTTEQTLKGYELARKFNFKTINMDLIAGLSGDSYDSFVNSLNTAISLKPENITLHTLTIKRAANLSTDSEGEFKKGETLAQKMVNMSGDAFYRGGYYPYYMYRQKSTLSNLENVGYCTLNHEGYYNIYIMDEVHTIIALGAGAVTKLKSPYSEEIKRVYNYKYPTEYLSGFENIINRKREVLSFYEKNNF